ncbi:MAG: endonuclease domain-containing protein [Luteimonas sp.]
MREGHKESFARHLRKNMTGAEQILWRVLRSRALTGFKFRRQHPVGPYIVDFACLQASLVIEVDGGQHCDSTSDARRDQYLRSRKFDVLRFWNNEVLDNIEGVCDVILLHLGTNPHPALSLQARTEKR